MRRENEFRYSKLANILREQIYSGYIKPGEFLFSENELCRYYGISRTSVRKSLEQLQKEGLIVKKVGQGTIVSPDLIIPESQMKVLRIMAPVPSHFADHALPMMIDAFKRKYPNVEVKLLGFPAYNFRESMRAAMELGHAPHLMLITDRTFEELQQVSSFTSLDERFSGTLSAMYPRIVDAFRIEGQVKAMPATFSPVYLAYNPELFAQFSVPKPAQDWSVSDFMDAARKLTVDTDNDGILNQYGLLLSASISRWPVFALQNGYTFRSTSERAALVKTLEFMQDLLYRKRSVSLYQAPSGLNSEAFLRGKTAMVLTTSIEMASWLHDDIHFKPEVAPLPFGPEKASLLVANAFMIPEACPDFDLAAQFLDTAFDPALQIAIARQSGFLSCLTLNREVWDESYLHSLNIIDNEIINCQFLAEIFEDPMLIGELDSEMDLFWAGLESPDEVADRFARII
ncbi:extracellular solute-binding protein [Paenibacillus koleovorans]|uniref:extracellular solute-binding protein n=1 Tax=Paenibacillus koleovorans TaxID=121608 RepID=UPI000FDB4C38|nr:extracellular solute-binding protein [Paenibacillus koleovorans]